MKKLLRATVAVFMTLAAVMPVSAVNDSVLLEDGVEVSMSSAEMEAGNNNLDNGTSDPTIKRSMAWYKANQSEIENKNTQFDSLDLVSLEGEATIQIDDDKTYQSFLGMGTSVDESTIYNLIKMTPEKQREIIKLLVDPVEGEGMTLFRLPIGSSDYTHVGQNFYSYYDVEDENTFSTKIENPDWYNETGNGFSIQKDKDLKIIDTIHLIQEVASECGVLDEIKFFASPWSLPGWMKEFDPDGGKIDISGYLGLPAGSYYHDVFGSQEQYKDNEVLKSTRCYGLVGGDFDDECIDDAAMYFRRYLEEYAKEGIDVYAITLQNEPGQPSGYSSGNMTPSQQAKIARSLKNLLSDSSVDTIKDTQIWGIDFNAEVGSANPEKYQGALEYFKGIISEDATAIDGVGLHDYSSGQTTMQALRDIYAIDPSKSLNITERSLWGTYGMNRVVQFFRNNAESYTSWVTMMDSDIKSCQMGGDPDPTLLVQEVSDRNAYRVMPETYMLGQFTKYIRPGYVRVDSTDTIGTNDFGISNVVFKDPDTGKLVMVVVNNSNEDQTFTAACDDYQFSATVPACNVATYQWNPNDIDVSAPEISGNDATIYVGDTTDLKTILNLKVTDDKDGEISEYTINDNGYDCQKAGKYVIEVSASDKAGNEAKASFTVTVKEKEAVVENTENKGDSTNKPTKQETTNSSNAVKTGDESQLEIYGAVVLGLAVIGGLYVTRKKLIKK